MHKRAIHFVTHFMKGFVKLPQRFAEMELDLPTYTVISTTSNPQ
jgi:hypothetical protein